MKKCKSVTLKDKAYDFRSKNTECVERKSYFFNLWNILQHCLDPIVSTVFAKTLVELLSPKSYR